MNPELRALIRQESTPMYQRRDPVPTLGRMMVFVDGENIVARFQAMTDQGRKALGNVAHKRDVYVWAKHAVFPGLNVISRATLYTYVTGGAEQVQSVAQEIQALPFYQYEVIGENFCSYLVNTLYPRVFSKPKNRSGKGVDIQLTVDVLTNVYQNNLDTVFLVSGDGDYAPLINESQRMGKQVIVAALSSGLSPSLRLLSDKFYDLDTVFFEPTDAHAA